MLVLYASCTSTIYLYCRLLMLWNLLFIRPYKVPSGTSPGGGVAASSTGAAGAAVPLESYHTTLPWSSRASPPITYALLAVVELNRPTVRLLSRCVCFCSFFHLFCSCVALFAFSLFAVPSDVPTTKYAFNATAPTRTACCCCCTCEHRTRAAAAVPMTCSLVILGCCCSWYSSIK